MLKRDSLDTHVELTDLLALKLAASPAEKLRSEIPAGLLVNVARQYEIIGTIATGQAGVRKVPGDAKQVLCWALALMEPQQLLALRMLVKDRPSAEQMAAVGEYVDLLARETVVSPAVRGAVTVEVVG